MISYDAGAAAYDLLSGRWSLLYIPALLAQAGIAVGQRVLDVATGTGEAAILAADRVGGAGKVVGIDVSRPMLGVAAAKKTEPPIVLLQMDAEALAFKDESFDAVVCQLGLMFLPDPARRSKSGHAFFARTVTSRSASGPPPTASLCSDS